MEPIAIGLRTVGHESPTPPKSTQCGATHADCPNAWRGSCELSAGHGGSHLCSACKSYF
jgi:hypothetical protein